MFSTLHRHIHFYCITYSYLCAAHRKVLLALPHFAHYWPMFSVCLSHFDVVGTVSSFSIQNVSYAYVYVCMHVFVCICFDQLRRCWMKEESDNNFALLALSLSISFDLRKESFRCGEFTCIKPNICTCQLLINKLLLISLYIHTYVHTYIHTYICMCRASSTPT